MSRLIPDPPPGLRERARANGTVRLWWEPTAAQRRAGMTAVDLDPARLTWSRREAERLAEEGARIARGEPIRPRKDYARSVEALVNDYMASRRYTKLADATRRSYARFFDLIVRKWGKEPVVAFSKPVIDTWYEALLEAKGPAMASAMVRHFSILMSHAELRGWRAENSNPCVRLKMTSPKGRRRVVTWAEYDALLATADRLGMGDVALAIVMSFWHAQRQTDVATALARDFSRVPVQLPEWDAPRTMWVWTLQQKKRGNEVSTVIHPEAAARLEAALATCPPGAQVVAHAGGAADRQHPADVICHRFAQLRAEAAKSCKSLRSVTYRDLRRTAGVNARGAGVSKDDVGDLLGNSAATNQRLADVYMTPGLVTASRAVLALRRPGKPEEREEEE